MKLDEYKKIVKRNSEKDNKISNMIIAFISGGFVSLCSEIIFIILNKCFKISLFNSFSILSIILIIVACILTGLSIFDKIASKYKAGVLVPITGFAHAMSSSAMDNNDEGLIYGIGSGMFKLGGTVVVYGVISAFFFAVIKGVLF